MRGSLRVQGLWKPLPGGCTGHGFGVLELQRGAFDCMYEIACKKQLCSGTGQQQHKEGRNDYI